MSYTCCSMFVVRTCNFKYSTKGVNICSQCSRNGVYRWAGQRIRRYSIFDFPPPPLVALLLWATLNFGNVGGSSMAIVSSPLLISICTMESLWMILDDVVVLFRWSMVALNRSNVSWWLVESKLSSWWFSSISITLLPLSCVIFKTADSVVVISSEWSSDQMKVYFCCCKDKVAMCRCYVPWYLSNASWQSNDLFLLVWGNRDHGCMTDGVEPLWRDSGRLNLSEWRPLRSQHPRKCQRSRHLNLNLPLLSLSTNATRYSILMRLPFFSQQPHWSNKNFIYIYIYSKK